MPKSNRINKLSKKQEMFCRYYVSNGHNATKAAISAGYKKKNARSTSSENLTKPNIQAFIEKLEQPVGVADLLFNIGFSKMRSEKYEEARVFLESSLQIQEQKIDNIKKAKTLNLLSLIELQLQNNFYALEQLIDAQECLSGREKDLNAIINFNMSQVYRVRDDFVNLQESPAIFVSLNDTLTKRIKAIEEGTFE